ncbi:MAG TPA: carbonic anhydrase [Xanthobacteraceae bacterium]|nr:carbonic anhydrase [Xanthobacteraceae bacterium]
MCNICEKRAMGRRQFLALAGFGLAAGSSLFGWNKAFAAGETTSVTVDQALANLKSGNDKFVNAPQVCAADLAKSRARVAGHQMPWATIVSCADSRVPPELLFGGLGVGELFVARNAGNMVDTATMGTVEYGAAVLGTPLVVVLGHERCGAVAAACDVVTKKATFPGSIGPMVKAIVPAAQAVKDKPGDFVDNAVRESARRTAVQIATKSKIVAGLVKAGKVKVVAARYDLDDGKVEYLA